MPVAMIDHGTRNSLTAAVARMQRGAEGARELASGLADFKVAYRILTKAHYRAGGRMQPLVDGLSLDRLHEEIARLLAALGLEVVVTDPRIARATDSGREWMHETPDAFAARWLTCIDRFVPAGPATEETNGHE